MGRKHAAMAIFGMTRDPASHLQKQGNDDIVTVTEKIGSSSGASQSSSSPLANNKNVRSRSSWISKLSSSRDNNNSSSSTSNVTTITTTTGTCLPFEIDSTTCSSQMVSLLHPEQDYADDEEAASDLGNHHLKSNMHNNTTTATKPAIAKARFQILFAAVLYGTSFPLTKILDDHIPLGPSLALRFGLATLVTLPWLWEEPAIDWPTTSRPALVQGMGVGVWVSIGFLAQAIGIVTTQANKVWNVHVVIWNKHDCD